jgi:hypothetical protein
MRSAVTQVFETAMQPGICTQQISTKSVAQQACRTNAAIEPIDARKTEDASEKTLRSCSANSKTTIRKTDFDKRRRQQARRTNAAIEPRECEKKRDATRNARRRENLGRCTTPHGRRFDMPNCGKSQLRGLGLEGAGIEQSTCPQKPKRLDGERAAQSSLTGCRVDQG